MWSPLMNYRAFNPLPGQAATSAGQRVSSSPDPVQGLRTQLCKIQESVSDTQNAVIAQATAVNSVLRSFSVTSRCHGCLTNEAYSARSASGSAKRHDGMAKSEAHLSHQESQKEAFSAQSLSLRLGTSIETSRNFFAESYTVDARVPASCLTIVSFFEQSNRVESRTSVYKLLYLNSSRHWQWLTISMQVSCLSRYWAATKTSGSKPQCPNTASSAVLPYTLLRKIQDFLRRIEGLEDNALVNLSLSDVDIVKKRPQIPDSGILAPSSWPLSAMSDAMTYLHDLGCPRYDESEVVQIEMINPPHCFWSSLHGMLVYETKFMDSIPSVEMLYTIRVLHCMKGSSGFAKLVGIVTDDSGRHIKSYLIEPPQACRNLVRMAGDTSVSWKRRRKWAIQLVRGIDRMHAHGFVVGILVRWLIPFIDENDSVQFWQFKERLGTGHTVGAYYPPEFLHVRTMPQETDEVHSPYSTSKVDIFHLGMVLWLLAENKPQTHASPVCGRMRCNGRERDCDMTHAEPIALPRLSESVPEYFRNIVDACRKADPGARPAAREILEMFPLYEDCPQQKQQEGGFDRHEQTQLRSHQARVPDIDTLMEGIRGGSVSCSECGRKPLPFPYYHCNICQEADFDLCQTCYDLGRHCEDDQHLLVEMSTVGSWVVPRRYGSCIKEVSGEREVVEL